MAHVAVAKSIFSNMNVGHAVDFRYSTNRLWQRASRTQLLFARWQEVEAYPFS